MFSAAPRGLLNDAPRRRPPYAITDRVEREVVSVLKAELHRYEICGRRVGGLGSVTSSIKAESSPASAAIHGQRIHPSIK